jgi:hypothetical protein
LRVITQPIPKVDALDIHLAEFLVGGARHEKGKERVLDVSVTPIYTFDSRCLCNIACAKGVARTGPEDEKDEAWEEK